MMQRDNLLLFVGYAFVVKKSDFVVSATRSPHRTVKPEKVKRLSKIPELMIDLAMPRDIDAAVGEFCTVKNIFIVIA